MKVKILIVLFAIVALPFLLEGTIGCTFHSPGPGPEPVDPNAYVCACSCSPGNRHRSLRIQASADDIEQQLPVNGSAILTNSPDLDFLNGRYVGLRFPDVQIPQGSHIDVATVQFTAAPGSTTGLVTLQIAAEASDNAPAFSTTSGSLTTLFNTAATMQKVTWSPPNWTVGTAQVTPDLDNVVGEIVNRVGWTQGNALVLLFKGTSGSALRKAQSYDGQPGAAALLTVEYEEPTPSVVGPQELPICLPTGSGTAETDLASDCENRVVSTLSGLAEACGYPSDCTCGMQTGAMHYSESLLWADTCDQPCVEDKVDVAHDCANFDPAHSLTSATNADGDTPVCDALSPLSAQLFGRRTACEVDGTAHVTIDDDTKNPHAQGVVQFVGSPCPGGTCAVGMEYKLDIGSVTFGNFFHSETFDRLGGIGETLSGHEAMLATTGDGSFAADTAGIAAQGRRGSQLNGLATTNGDAIDIILDWGAMMPQCEVHGTVLGSVDPEVKHCDEGDDLGKVCEEDSDCAQSTSCSDMVCNCVAQTSADVTLRLDVTGFIANQPPKANAGPDQTLECTSAAVTNVLLDGSASSDPDDNIALFSWRRGSRIGTEVGFDQKSKIEQSHGAQTYFLRVIDAVAQSDEDSVKVSVVDTKPPVLTCSVTSPILNQTNHDLVNAGLMSTATDQCDGQLPVTVKVFGDENDQENTSVFPPFLNSGVLNRDSPDAKNIGVGSLRLRAERRGNGDGRVYLIVVRATDGSDNSGFNCCTMAVPLSTTGTNQRKAMQQAAAAQSYCLAHNGMPPPGYFVVGDGPVIGPKQ